MGAAVEERYINAHVQIVFHCEGLATAGFAGITLYT